MTDEQYRNYANVIVAVREFTSFNHKTISSVVGLTPHRSGTVIRKLLEFKCIREVSSESGSGTKMIRNYAVRDDAITRLRSQFEKERLANLPLFPKAKKVEAKKPRKVLDDFMCGLSFVDKANVSGMGNPMLMKIDSLLKGVRNELHVMQ
ncbi:hypothetical protein JNG78_16975 [Proteus mirabilis]|uniref:hypothetical protein n=1 Tax=Proteus mirabilis TaxID=584 RepID=UPI001FADA444|nr:hypothetical protein [Proteus mirabilis]MCI9729398.1 hypothetical protein [Proteus mirabilis]MCI9733153.1 hypothetical protein [Proteus mirabilis]MCI9736910.1 hypothetical protein [Proteus mirabilis]MCI9757754.1 hypothetical protein [Proteus mirabilis]MCI9761512.1 hypothetical protein [Proteus mirabilis]